MVTMIAKSNPMCRFIIILIESKDNN
jgi:hypothetical protein